jgi:hypothetical protein
MQKDLIGYELLGKEATISVIRSALMKVSNEGFPGDHHFYITFFTSQKNIVISDELLKRFPTEMTIVLQHQFFSLEVKSDKFAVVLHFNNIAEKITIPFVAIKTFVDPAVNFKIELNYTNNKEDISVKEEILSQEDPYNENKEVKDKEAKGAKILSIDKFRKDIK